MNLINWERKGNFKMVETTIDVMALLYCY